MVNDKKRFLGGIFFMFMMMFFPAAVRALEPGTLLYRTSSEGKIFGQEGDVLIDSSWGLMSGINSGHVAIYVGRENGEDYIVEAGPSGLIKTAAKHFINLAAGEEFLGARIPIGLSVLQQAKVVTLAKSLAEKNFAYDFDFRYQKGAGDGEWTCVGLTEKIYESANISNPNNTSALEYNPAYYALNITPDGFDNYSPANADGDRFSKEKEFSLVERRRQILLPAPEIIGFNAGLEKDGERYIFLPYTQFLQTSLRPVELDIEIASDFPVPEIRGQANGLALALRWSLINNPLSSLKIVVDKVETLARKLGDKIFGAPEEGILLVNNEQLAAGKNNQDQRSVLEFMPISKNTGDKQSVISGSQGATGAVGGSSGPLVSVIKSSADSSQLLSGQHLSSGNSDSGTIIGVDKNNVQNNFATNSSVTPTLSKIQVNAQTEAAASGTSSGGGVKVNSLSSLYNLSLAVSASVAQLKSTTTGSAQINQNTAVQALAAADAPKIARINRIYATGNNDWIELYNPGDYDFDLATAGYRLERTRSAEDPSIVMRIGNSADGSYPGGTIIKARGTYLIVRADANDYYKNKAQAIGTRADLSWTGSGYTIYLGTGSISSSADEDIVEAVGFGPDATYFQGAAPAPLITDNYILQRHSFTYNNANDFGLVLSDDPGIVWSDPNSGQSAGGGGGQTMAVIQAIYATENNDWIELYNPGDQDFDLAAAAYRLEKTKSAEDPALMMRIGNIADGSYPGGTIIKARGTYLIVRADAEESFRSQAQALATRSEFSWPTKDYTIYLGTGAISSSTDPDIIDAVGFGAAATYFVGSGPAPEISDNHVLVRVNSQGDNMTDFSLTPLNPQVVEPPLMSDMGLYVSPVPIISPGLMDLWHFADCHILGSWNVGKWDCARELGGGQENFYTPLSSAMTDDSLSLSFYYRPRQENSRVVIRFLGDTPDGVMLGLEHNLITVEGLSNSQWHYDLDLPFDDAWRQGVLVVNRADDYWAIYLNGQEVIREVLTDNIPSIFYLEIGGDGAEFLLDQLAFWRRALSPEEIAYDYLSDKPYSPFPVREPQQAAELLHAWDFEEHAGLMTVDSVTGLEMSIGSTVWAERGPEQNAIMSPMDNPVTTPLYIPLTGGDLSLSFWWQNFAQPEDGQTNVYLNGGVMVDVPLFALKTSSLFPSFYFNGESGTWPEGAGVIFPYDRAWHQAVMVYDSYRQKLSLYANGEERAYKFFPWMSPDLTINNLQIFSNNQPTLIDDVRIYRGALRPAEVQDLYLNGR